MYIDSSRARFDKAKHYSGVLAQQGRVTLDSDTVEQGDILLHYLRTAIADIIGPAGYPFDGGGFLVDTPTEDRSDGFTVSEGRIYVDGILVENDADTAYWTQPYGYLDKDFDSLPNLNYLAYLRVWERSVNALQDPDIKEVALGIHGPDTAARSQVVWQVDAFDLGDATPDDDGAVKQWRAWLNRRYSPGTLRARAADVDNVVIEVCSVAPDSKYRGNENQHYRVEIVRSGFASSGSIFTHGSDSDTRKGATTVAAADPKRGVTTAKAAAGPKAAAVKKTAPAKKTAAKKTAKTAAAKKAAAADAESHAKLPDAQDHTRADVFDTDGSIAQFVWSRENGSVVFGIESRNGAEVTLDGLGRDLPSGLELDDWVEICDDASEARNAIDVHTGHDRALFKVTAIDVVNRVVTLDRDPADEIGSTGTSAFLHPLLRRWDSAGAIDVVEGGWIHLEDGVQVSFPGSGDVNAPSTYRSGDYWLVPARVITGDVIWPRDDQDQPAALLPHGVVYHYAPLAIVPAAAGGAITDLRDGFSPLAQ